MPTIPIDINSPTARAIAALREPDASLARVPNTVRQSLADLIQHLDQKIDKYGLALMFIREGCEAPQDVAAKALSADT